VKLKLDDSVSSPQDLKSMIVEIREYARWFGHNSIKKRLDARHSSEPPALSPGARAILHEWNTKQPLSQKSLDGLISTLEKYHGTAPQLTITLAAPPANGLKKTLVVWCRDNIAPDVLVTFQFNATLLGGMVVRCGSHIFDWSFRRQLLANREQFPKVLRRV